MTRKKKSSDAGKVTDTHKAKTHKDGLWDIVSKTAKPLEGREYLYSQHLEGFLSSHEDVFESKKHSKKPVHVHRKNHKPDVVQKVTHPPSKSQLKLNVLGMLEHGDSPGVDKRTAQRLKRGKMLIDAKVDLHGYGLEQAHIRLSNFVQSSYAAGHRCILVVTGKGEKNMGAIKQSVPRWLNDAPLRDKILSFSFAQIEDGGKGALYVLLKRKRDY
ncbi:Smr/MutS family protein [Curvivirga sp.]|uniref:Smr/MutS family protein n=1 Tax=Curvivirga sp. TaxID=2856848 RepID=UPI003B5C2135